MTRPTPHLHRQPSRPRQRSLWIRASLSLVVLSGLTTAADVLDVGRLASPFVEASGDVAFEARTFAGTVFVTPEGRIGYALPALDPDAAGGVVLVEDVSAGRAVAPVGQEPSPTTISRFVGNDPSAWRRDLPGFSSVRLDEIWPGVTLELRAAHDQVEKIYHVAPGAALDGFIQRIAGADALRVDTDGQLVVETARGPIRFTAPVAWQPGDDAPVPVDVAYRLMHDGNDDGYGFALGDHDPSLPLVIDPFLGSTYIGGGGNDWSRDIAVSASGDVFITGTTQASDYPTTAGAYDTSYAFSDVFISKLSPDMTTLIASTFLGGGDTDDPVGLLFVGDQLFVAGHTSSSNFPTTPGAFDGSHNGNSDVFISRLSTDLTTLQASTLIGGLTTDRPYGMDLLGSSIVVAGHGASPDYPTTPGVWSTTPIGLTDLFVTVIDPGLTTLVASTFFGGGSTDSSGGMCVVDGQVLLTGQTGSSNFPTTPGAYDTTLTGSKDVYVSRLSGDLTTLVASTFLGGSVGSTNDEEEGTAITADSGAVYVTGWTITPNFPVTAGAFDTSFNAADYYDVFIARLSPDLTTLAASTFLGGIDDDVAHDIASSPTHVYVTGETESNDYPTTLDAYDETPNGNQDVLVSKLSLDLASLAASTVVGGPNDDEGRGLALSGGSVYVVGDSYSAGYPTTPDAFDPDYNGAPLGADTVVTRLSDDLGATWRDLGQALAGTPGLPTLLGEGSFLGGQPIVLSLGNALPNGVAWLVIGFSNLGAAFKGGVLVPKDDIVIGTLPVDPAGDLVIAFPWIMGAPSGAFTYYQYWIPDPGGPVGWAASNAVSGVTP